MCKIIIENLIKIFTNSVAAVLPANLIKKSLKYNSEVLNVCGHEYNLKDKQLYVIGFGKAVKNMAIEIENMLDSKIKQGIVSVPIESLEHDESKRKILYIEGARNNLPDLLAENTSRKVKSLITSLTKDDILLVLISGGGSALLPLPKSPITLYEKTSVIKMLGNAGADIKELNSVRKRISDLKGGKLAIESQPAHVVSLILSDIVGDPLDLIASGPTVENKDVSDEALKVIQKYELFTKIPESVKHVLQSSELIQPFPDNNVKNYIIGSNKICVEASIKEIKLIGYTPIVLSHTITGNVKQVAQDYLKITQMFCDYCDEHIDLNCLKNKLNGLNLPNINEFTVLSTDVENGICLVLSGETTVQVKGNGVGGRNQQLALEFSILLNENRHKLNKFSIYFLSAGTDGIDGPTDAAGALGYLNLVLDAEKENLDVQSCVDNNDSYTFYKMFQNGAFHVITGHTNTNVMDIHLLFIKRNSK
ncbi:unnamed protein product [Leptidea sinapis]|uniref:Glycerate kinase n=1 Tax=Leptidea sinapis TaxID=189913 RepID=A0A5E4R8F0_9NEOP|nr:unnamed protein product [Leptidea sinapis]